MEKILYAILVVALAVFSISAQASTILVTGSIINNTSYKWGYSFYLTYLDDVAKTSVPPSVAPARGRFMVAGVPHGVSSDIKYDMKIIATPNVDGEDTALCTFLVRVISPTHAEMKLVSKAEDSHVLCSYSGNPDDNTATITLTEKPRSIKK